MMIQEQNNSSIKLLISCTVNELQRIREVILNSQAVEAGLQSSLDALYKIDNKALDYLHLPVSLDNNNPLLKATDFPVRGSKEEKVLYIIRKKGHVMRVIDVTHELERLQGAVQGRRESKSLSYTMNQMVADGQLLVTKVNGSNRLTFFSLPEFFSRLEKGQITLKSEYYPPADAWGRMPIEDQNFDSVKWISFIKHE